MTRSNHGFTLIELIIVVAIVTIISVIAYPSYVNYGARSRLADAKARMLTLSQQLEQLYSNTGSFAGASCNASAACPTPATGTSYFNVFYNSSTAATYTITATATNSFTSAYATNPCTTLTLDSTGNKTASGSAGSTSASVDSCWNK